MAADSRVVELEYNTCQWDWQEREGKENHIKEGDRLGKLQMLDPKLGLSLLTGHLARLFFLNPEVLHLWDN